MYSGFAESVAISSSEQLIVALDVVVPIQRALGELFCDHVDERCLAAKLAHIELQDAAGSRALVRVSIGARELPQELVLALVRDAQGEVERWKVEAPSLRRFAEVCRQAGSGGAS